MTDLSLTAVILRYRAEMFTQLANQIEAEERGEDTDHPVTYWPLIETIENWSRPADSLPEAIEALTLAIEDYEKGDTPRIPAMMKAAAGWMDAEYKRRCRPMTSNVFPSLSLSVNMEKFEPSDVFYALHELHYLTETLVDHMGEMDFGTDGGRNHALDRAYALAKIVSDHVALCAKLAEPFDGPAKWERKS